MSYNFSKVQDTNFCCLECLIGDMIEVLDLGNDVNKSVTVVGDEFLIQDLLRTFANIELGDGDRFNFELIDLDTVSYSDLYYFSVTNDMDIYIEKAWHPKNEWHDAGYLYTEGDIVYIEESCNSAVFRKLNDGENNIVIFGFED